MSVSQSITVTQGSDNVFYDLGFSPEEAMNLQIKADLMLELRSFIEDKGWTLQEAAAFFEETQPRISDLINGDLDDFSLDKLVNMLARAGMKVKLEVF